MKNNYFGRKIIYHVKSYSCGQSTSISTSILTRHSMWRFCIRLWSRGVDPETNEVVGNTIEAQTHQCLRNLEIILEQEGLTLDHVIKANAFVSQSEDFPGYNKIYSEVFKQPYPARTTAPVNLGSFLVEIDVIAYAPAKRGES